jgi:hypothetical protein
MLPEPITVTTLPPENVIDDLLFFMKREISVISPSTLFPVVLLNRNVMHLLRLKSGRKHYLSHISILSQFLFFYYTFVFFSLSCN